MKEFTFTTTMKTRDYECDVQGVVNNANYQHYLEVARHEFIQSIGESFEGWHNKGIDVMVSKIVINYKASLRGGEEFICGLNMKRSGVRYVFMQEIYRKSDEKLCITAEVHCVCVVNGVLTRGEEIEDKFMPYLTK
ncbi:MAG: acyl-CoA thioesterase [Bacteroidales bacterium]|nr:acyl-CoA thioesterase [Bacteroidales bacterium]